jgi:cyclase
MKGYDFNLVEKIRGYVTIPTTIMGGAGSHEDLHKLIQRFGTIGACAGSLFVFKGIYRAVLINYPNRVEKNAILNGY